MRITAEQMKLIDTFACVRLSSDINNLSKIQTFCNPRGEGIIEYMKKLGWSQDQNNETAFYLINLPSGAPALFFALKCGALYKPLNEEALKEQIERNNYLLFLLHDSPDSNPNRADLINTLKKASAENGLSLDQIIEPFAHRLDSQRRKHFQILSDLQGDVNREGKRPIQRVHATFPGVEITHFCTNADESVREEWKSFGFRFPMGAVLFWKFIVSKFIELQKIAGCQYAFLFAADNTADRTLTNYYNVTLKFDQPLDIGTIKPRYDFCCEFMCQEINAMQKNRVDFFEHFNLDENEEIV